MMVAVDVDKVRALKEAGLVTIEVYRDPMDDSTTTTVSIPATTFEPAGIKPTPKLGVRVRSFNGGNYLEALLDVAPKFFARRGPNPEAVLRRDTLSARDIKVSYSEGKNAVFFENGGLLFEILQAERLLLKLSTRHGASILGTFDTGGGKEAFRPLATSVFGTRYDELMHMPQALLLHMATWNGPRRMKVKTGLKQAGFYGGEVDGGLTMTMFTGVFAYATERRCSEVFGIFETDRGPPNMNFAYVFSKEFPALRD